MWQESFFSAFICVVLTSEFWGNVSSKFLDAARRLPIEDYWYRVYTYMYIYSWFTYTSTFEVDDLQCPSSVTCWWMLVWPRGLLKQQRGTERPEELQPQQSLKQKPRCRTCPGRPWEGLSVGLKEMWQTIPQERRAADQDWGYGWAMEIALWEAPESN